MDRERERVLSAYERLRVHHPALPPNLRDFQVVFHMKRRNFEGEFLFEQVDLISAMTNSEAKDHLLGALPTGYGKSLPMLVASLLLPPGIELALVCYQAYIDWRRWTLHQRNWMKANLSCLLAVSPSSQPCPSNQSRVQSPKSCPASCDWEVGTP